MIFQHTWDAVLNGTKTETRRLRKPGDRAIYDVDGTIAAVATPTGYMRYRVGNRYAIQPGRGQHSVGSFVLAGIRLQWLPDITDEEIRREGFPTAAAFWATWTAMHEGIHYRVWVLELELASKKNKEAS